LSWLLSVCLLLGDSGMPALGIELSGHSAVPRVPRSFEPASVDTATANGNGGCIRGFLWALAFEAASVAMLAALLFGIYRL
jgi:hypothetical protein